MKEYAIYWINIFDIVRCKHDTTQVGCKSASHALERAVSWLVTWPGQPMAPVVCTPALQFLPSPAPTIIWPKYKSWPGSPAPTVTQSHQG